MRRGIVILGATGSIGKSAKAVLQAFPEHFRVVGLAARNNLKELAEQAAIFRPDWTVTTDPLLADELAREMPPGCKSAGGMEKVFDLVSAPETDIVLCAIVGTAGLEPVIAALRAGKRVALASKEILVLAGEIIRRELTGCRGELIPVDSEHSAIFQCLAGRKAYEIKTLYLTASGGAFRDKTPEEIAKATFKDALAHPTWNMGYKVTIDSASMMNKALEMVEARYLFDVRPDQIKAIIHPQSIVHSMVELCDASLIAQLAAPDMRFAIQYAFTHPERLEGDLPAMDFSSLLTLDFRAARPEQYPAIAFACEAMNRGGTLPGVMNAANEVAVEKFRRGEISFPDIWRIIEKTMAAHTIEPQSDFPTVRAADAWARAYAQIL